VSVPAPRPLLKWGEMIEWLKANGVRRGEALRYVAAGKIKPRTLPPSNVKHYSAAEIQREILDQLKA
jgi:predicted site-specific integrase-resolvase